MIVVRVPFRVSFFGGGTDYPDWYVEHGGRTLATTIRQYAYVSLRRLPRGLLRHRVRIVHVKAQRAAATAALKHPVFREVFRHMGIRRDIEARCHTDLPSGSGLGSSSALTVGLLHAIHELRRSAFTPMSLAREAIHVERNILKEAGGVQDQVAVTHGGLNRMDFGRGDAIEVTPVRIASDKRRALERCLMLAYTGSSRIGSNVIATYQREMMRNDVALRSIMALADVACERFQAGDGKSIGLLLDEAWALKQRLSSNISSSAIQQMLARAKRAGAWGGKLLGAGGGGFLLLAAPPCSHARIRQALGDIAMFPVLFEDAGSVTLYRGAS